MQVCHYRLFKKHDAVTDQGTDGDEFFFVVSGRCTMFQRRNNIEHAVRDLKPGTYFGEASIVTKTPRLHSVKVIEDHTQMLVVGWYSFNNYLSSQPQIKV